MGLESKRRIKELQDDIFPGVQAKIERDCGVKVAIDADWASFKDDTSALDNVEHQGVGRIWENLRFACRDDVGKELMQKALKRISLKNVESPKQKKATLKGGTLTVLAAWGAGSDGYPADQDLKAAIDAAL